MKVTYLHYASTLTKDIFHFFTFSLVLPQALKCTVRVRAYARIHYFSGHLMRLRWQEDYLYFLDIMRAARKLTRHFDEGLRSVGLTCGQFCILASIKSGRSTAITPLAARLAMDRKTLSAALKILQRKQLVAAATTSKDSRRRLVSITRLGRRRLLQALPIWSEKCRAIAAALNKGGWHTESQTSGARLNRITSSARIH